MLFLSYRNNLANFSGKYCYNHAYNFLLHCRKTNIGLEAFFLLMFRFASFYFKNRFHLKRTYQIIFAVKNRNWLKFLRAQMMLSILGGLKVWTLYFCFTQTNDINVFSINHSFLNGNVFFVHLSYQITIKYEKLSHITIYYILKRFKNLH